MHDDPAPHDLLEGVIRFLRDTAVPQLAGRAAYDARIAASLLLTVQRQLPALAAGDAAEQASVLRLLGSHAPGHSDLTELNRALCERIATGDIAWDDAALLSHLWTVTLAKLAVDQPGYSTYVRVLAGGPATAGAVNSSDTTISPASSHS